MEQLTTRIETLEKQMNNLLIRLDGELNLGDIMATGLTGAENEFFESLLIKWLGGMRSTTKNGLARKYFTIKAFMSKASERDIELAKQVSGRMFGSNNQIVGFAIKKLANRSLKGYVLNTMVRENAAAFWFVKCDPLVSH